MFRIAGMLIRLLIFFSLVLCGTVIAADKIIVNGLFKDKAIVSIDGKQRVLSLNAPSPEGVTLISATAKEAVLEVNGVQKIYLLNASTVVGGSHYSLSKPDAIVNVVADNQGMYWSSGSINGIAVKFLVDTGATLVAMNRNTAKRLGLDYLKGQQGLASTASGTVRTYLVNLKRVRVGDIELNNIQGAVNDSNFPPFVLLGNSFLQQLNMQYDGKLLKLHTK